MLTRTIKYIDFDGIPREEEFHFHLSKAKLAEKEIVTPGGYGEYLTRIVESEDGRAVIDTFKELLRDSYGHKSVDGKRFIHDGFDEFEQTEAYSILFMELVTDADAGAAFFNGILPADLSDAVRAKQSEIRQPQDYRRSAREVFQDSQQEATQQVRALPSEAHVVHERPPLPSSPDAVIVDIGPGEAIQPPADYASPEEQGVVSRNQFESIRPGTTSELTQEQIMNLSTEEFMAYQARLRQL